ncbi:MAG: hypothetical protein ACXADH_17275 [Candidatus Kariarchaeaceae archaeon]|jgi:hypothetical protein
MTEESTTKIKFTESPAGWNTRYIIPVEFEHMWWQSQLLVVSRTMCKWRN